MQRFTLAAFLVSALVGGAGSLVVAPALATPPTYCQSDLGGRVVTVLCTTCEDMLSQPGMAGNVDCSALRPIPADLSQPSAAGLPPAPGDPGQLNSIEQKYLADLAAIQIHPTSTAEKLAGTGNIFCGHLIDAYRRYPGPAAARGVKDGLASTIIAGNPGLTWDQAVGWVQAAVNSFCPDRITGMYYQ